VGRARSQLLVGDVLVLAKRRRTEILGLRVLEEPHVQVTHHFSASGSPAPAHLGDELRETAIGQASASPEPWVLVRRVNRSRALHWGPN
jgi:hypothetical protein